MVTLTFFNPLTSISVNWTSSWKSKSHFGPKWTGIAHYGLICRCFLLTPKLLPNLEYSDACSILTVMNGPWIEQPSKGSKFRSMNIFCCLVFDITSYKVPFLFGLLCSVEWWWKLGIRQNGNRREPLLRAHICQIVL